jgi:hypothetical protein
MAALCFFAAAYMEIAIVCRHGANKKKFVEATMGAAGKFGTENDLRSQLPYRRSAVPPAH